MRTSKSKTTALRRFGDTIVRTRLFANLTQELVAEAAGISVGFLRKVERGTGNPSYLTMLAIAKALDVALHDIVRDSQ